MKTTPGSAAERWRRLIFQWPGQSISFAFPLIFIAVIAVHLLTFYGFQVIYPPVSSVAPPPGEVMLIMPDNPAHRELLEWVDAQSPALAPRLEALMPEGLERVVYRPSYSDVETLPKPAAFIQRETVFPAAYQPTALLTPDQPLPETPRRAFSSSLRLSGALEGRLPGVPRLEFQHRSDGGLTPAVFLVGVGEHGRALHLFLQESSGSPSLDAEAEAALRRQTFKPRSGGVVWGLATFVWGGDALSAPARGEESRP